MTGRARWATVLLLFLLVGCRTTSSFAPDNSRDTERDSSAGAAEGDDAGSRQGTTGSEGGSERTPAPWVTSLFNLEEGQRVFEYNEGYFVQTPWFGVSAIVLQVRKSNSPTVIVLKEDMILTSVMRESRRVLIGEGFHGSGVRFRVNVGLYTGDAAPFLENQLVDELGFLAEE